MQSISGEPDVTWFGGLDNRGLPTIVGLVGSSATAGLTRPAGLSFEDGGFELSAIPNAELDPVAAPLRNRHTNRTPWNRESWYRFIAATHAASDR